MVFDPRKFAPGPNTVGTPQLQDNAVTEGKIADGVMTNVEQASQIDYSLTGQVISRRFERFEFFKDSGNKRNLKTLRVWCDLKTDNVTHQATLEIWLDNDGDWDGSDDYTGAGSPSGTFSTNSDSLAEGYIDIDISGLANGKHVVNMALKIANAAATAQTTAREYELVAKGT